MPQSSRMTNSQGACSDTLPERLKRGYRYARSLSEAAGTCWSNLAWLHANGFRWIPLPDFDIICGIFPVVKAHRQAECSSRGAPEEWSPEVIGPHTVGYLFRNLSEYCLPPGTVGEILTRKKMLSGNLSQIARRFLRVLDTARRAADPLSAVLKEAPSFGSVAEVLLAELESFGSQLGQLETLESMFRRYTPVQDLLGEKEDDRDARAFRHAYGLLNSTRPGMSLNNFNDALNIAATVRVFNTPALSGRGRRVPALITQTHAVLQFGEHQNAEKWLDAGGEVKVPVVFNTALYFIIKQALLTEFDGNYSVCANEASILAKHLAETECSYLRLISACKQMIANGRAEESITARDLPVYESEMLRRKLMAVECRWGRMLAPGYTLPEQDRLRYLRLLFTPRIKHLLTKKQPQAIREGIAAFERRLRTTPHPDADFWQPLMEYRSRSSVCDSTDVSTTIVLNEVPSDGTPLGDLTQGPAIDRDIVHLCEQRHDIRLVAFPRFVSHGAILAVDSWLDGDPRQTRRLCVVWVHNRETAEIWEEGYCIVHKLAGAEDKNAGVCRVFSEGSERLEIAMTENAFDAVDSLLAASENVTYFEMEREGFTFFADVVPLEDKEFQAGLIFPAANWTADLRESLVEVISRTHWLDMGRPYYEVTIQSLLDKVGVHPPCIW